jgi:hypothetical protein
MLDDIVDYGRMGFDVPGYSACPTGALPQPGSCCTADGSCTVTLEADCIYGTWTLQGVCLPNTCVIPTPARQQSWGQVKNRYR